MRIAARIAVVVVGVVIPHVEVGVDLQHGHIARRAARGVRLQRPDRDRMNAAEQDHEGIDVLDGVADLLDHRLRRQHADIVQHAMGDPVAVRRLGPGMALEQLDLAIEAGDDRRRPLRRTLAERCPVPVRHADHHRVGILQRVAVDDRLDHQPSSRPARAWGASSSCRCDSRSRPGAAARASLPRTPSARRMRRPCPRSSPP